MSQFSNLLLKIDMMSQSELIKTKLMDLELSQCESTVISKNQFDYKRFNAPFRFKHDDSKLSLTNMHNQTAVFISDIDESAGGFQGINSEQRVTTLGRGGTDASAIMLAKFFNAETCDIYTDVDGVYTTDPRSHLKAKKSDKISYDEMLEMASLGAKVMQPTSVQDAKLNNISFSVKSSFIKKKGTLIVTFPSLTFIAIFSKVSVRLISIKIS